MRQPIVAGNWKMYKTATEAEALVRALRPLVASSRAEVVICPPFTALERVGNLLPGSNLVLGAQNVYWESEGAFTGEIAPSMLRDLMVTYAIVGHSERRQFFGELDDTVGRRAAAALAGGLRAIVCVGERLDEREAGRTEEVVLRQARAALAPLDASGADKVVLAYEPVWAIGTGKVATPDQAQDVHALLRKFLAERFGADAASRIRIQYGGSVKPENAAELMAKPDIDGALVGGASLKADSFAAIVAAAG